MMDRAIYDYEMPRLVKVLGGRFCDGKRSWRMKWGELNIKPSCALTLCLFEEHFSLHIGLLFVDAYIRLGFLRRWHRDPHEGMESWGFSFDGWQLYCRWGRRYKFIEMPWADWRHVSHEVLAAGGQWVPYVGIWENGKKPDDRLVETYPYRYLLRSGEVQSVMARIHVERWKRTLRWLWYTPIRWTRYSISVEFSNEIGERSGSWKGGCVGCSYDLRPGESPKNCLKRMEAERVFD